MRAERPADRLDRDAGRADDCAARKRRRGDEQVGSGGHRHAGDTSNGALRVIAQRRPRQHDDREHVEPAHPVREIAVERVERQRVVHDEPILAPHRDPRRIPIERPSLAGLAASRRHPVQQHQRRALRQIESLRLPVRRGREADHRIRQRHQHAAAPYRRVEIGAGAVGRAIHFRRGLCREERRRPLVYLRVQAERITIDEAAAVGRCVNPCAASVVARRQQLQRARRERAADDAAASVTGDPQEAGAGSRGRAAIIEAGDRGAVHDVILLQARFSSA